ncbi:unnamed protein product [Arctia plantaginis]|uniref:ATP synthase subunit b n=1 Tax=Arctia plantaginis TaxID=874455 RepID=A0A8S0Z0F7_ARCPL|nr:unnamed protein product [Arctia plantaginis]
MITRRITGFGIHQLRFQVAVVPATHSNVCTPKKQVCPGSGKRTDRGTRGPAGTSLKRATHSGECRLGFIPEEWFQFLYSKTGVSGPYILMIGLANYVASKEILVMEHEYYSGLSVALVVYLVTKNFGRQIGEILDKEVKAVEDLMQKDRNEEIASHDAIIKDGELAQARAKAQEILMEAKKENIVLQLEAEYRERLMVAYRAVRDRLQYHLKRSRTEKRFQQRWMIEWILKNVNKSITPEFQREALSSAIRDLAALASQVKK